jgi:hypothetical protein
MNWCPTAGLYPQNEFAINADNVNEAVQAQYGGSDDINDRMGLK